MKKGLIILVVLLFVSVVGSRSFSAASGSAASLEPQAIAEQIIAREKASFDAWQRKDKAFFADYLTDDATFFGPRGPYLDTEPKVNFLPKFDQYAERFKILDFQMYNPRVQVYGDTAILTYNEAETISIGSNQTIDFTGKVTSVYVKQGNVWRVVHSHESINPKSQ